MGINGFLSISGIPDDGLFRLCLRQEVRRDACAPPVETFTCFVCSRGKKKFYSVLENRTFTFLQDLNRVSDFQWEAVLDRPSEAGQN